ncbi:MAG: lipoyl synthase, partial [Candidatus Eremiobacteraeota bacterium]|nr:lipoyl synthase [Candidatus Eremiobacteraeota bacterium]
MIARKPEWLKVKLPSGENYQKLRGIVKDRALHTVCQEAMCPNIAECWGVGTATFMILGDTCTRGCRFCNVKTGKPYELDPLEPLKLAKSIEELKLNYAVITCVDRDDLPDGGAQQMADSIRAIRRRTPHVKVEVLTSDYRGDVAALKTVIDAEPDVFAHNVETTRALTPHVRDRRCGYDQSLAVLANAKKMRPDKFTKSGLMLGLGETD